ncbi:MAG TPA: hypothetical protein VF226_18160 [Hyphomicrobiaceae bacterium]
MVESPPGVTAVCVTVAQLEDVVSAITRAPSTDADTLQGCVKAIIDVLIAHGLEEQDELIETGSAICARLIAFAALLKSAEIGPWIASVGVQASSLQRPLLQAMATAPLQVVQGHFRFDPKDFLDIALENTPPAGNG